MGYVLSILMNALRTWLLTKLWDSFFTRRFNGKQFWAYWLGGGGHIACYGLPLSQSF